MKDSAKVRNAIGQTQKQYLFYFLIPIFWGIYNIIAGILSIIFSESKTGIIWGGMMIAGISTQILLYKIFKFRKGFMLTSMSNVGKVWIIVMLAIFEATFILNNFAPVINDLYWSAVVAVFVGIGFMITGVLVQHRSMFIIGIIWIISANLFAYFIEYVYFIYIAVVFITMIMIPFISYFRKKGEIDAE